MELIGGRKNVDFKVSSAKFFSHMWVYDQLTANDLSEIVDKHLAGEMDEKQVVKLARVALACVQEEPLQRPAMSKVKPPPPISYLSSSVLKTPGTQCATPEQNL